MSAARIAWTTNALDAVRDHARWLRENGRQNPSEWIASVFERVGQLEEHPALGAPWRVAPQRRFRQLVAGGQVVIYRLRADEALIQALAVHHHAQAPLTPLDLDAT